MMMRQTKEEKMKKQIKIHNHVSRDQAIKSIFK